MAFSSTRVLAAGAEYRAVAASETTGKKSLKVPAPGTPWPSGFVDRVGTLAIGRRAIYHRSMTTPYLAGARVELRPLVESDAAECWPWFNDPEVRRTLAIRGLPNTEAISRGF